MEQKMNNQITSSTEYGKTLVRAILGIVLLTHGWLKVSVFTLPGTAGFFESVGLPGVLAYPVAGFEIIGGLLLIAGVATRWLALLSLPIMLGATWVHSGNGWVFSNANGGWEYPLLLAGLSVVVALLGPGALALRIRAKQSAA